MALVTGTRVGSFEITGKLGEGGMGEVYRATDTKLRREVAIKVLPAEFTADPDRLSRFEREAQLLAQLHHPNIASIFGLEDAHGSHALVMELVEGPTLAERLAQRSLPIEDCLTIAVQVARALEEAHEKAIVHRDLKPQNIKASVEGKVKVLDFGLAKAMNPGASLAGDATASQQAQSPTLTLAATQMGMILGTAAYMAPEQARGGAVDKRADIWAFGVVLYEMLTGISLFAGPTVSDTLAGVLKSEIDWKPLPAGTPPAIRRLLRQCLERNPKNRLRDITDARLVLDELLSGQGDEAVAVANPAGSPSRTIQRWGERMAFGLVALALAGAAWIFAARQGPEPERSAARFHLLPPEDGAFNGVDGPAELSPDGESIVFRFEQPAGNPGLSVRRLDSFDARQLPATEGAYDAFWSADGRSIGFFRSQLEIVDASGLQPPQKLAPIRDARGGSWNQDGVILFAPDPAGAIYRIPAAGGDAAPATVLDATRGETAHLRPAFLPDGRHFLYLIRGDRAENSGVFVGELDGPLKKRLMASASAARFAPPGFLLIAQDDRLVARRLDLERLEVTGDAAAVASGVDYVSRFDLLPVSAARNGRLVYHRPSTGGLRQTVRMDRAGKVLATLGEPGDINLDLSPDGRRLAFGRFDEERRDRFLWIHDLVRDVRFPLAPGTPATGPVWSPDGRSVAYAIETSTDPRIAVRSAEGGPERVIWRDPMLVEPVDWSPDGRWLLVEAGSPAERGNLILVPADGSGPAVPFAASRFHEESGRFSPDGRFIAYVADDSGRGEIYVEPVVRSGAKWLISRRGGSAPRWTRDGRELVYVEPGAREGDSTLVSVAIEARGSELTFGVVTALTPIASTDIEVAADGREIFATVAAVQGVVRPPVVIENWPVLLPPQQR